MPFSQITRDLLAKVEPLAAPQRRREITEFARKQPLEHVRTVTRDLESGTQYEQLLVARMACITDDSEWIIGHLEDRDPAVQAWAMNAARTKPDLVPDAVLQDAFVDASAVTRKRLIRVLDGRPVLADRVVETLRAECGDAVAVTALVYCSAKVVRRLLPELLSRVGNKWLLARKHPEPLLEQLQVDLSAAADAQDWWEQNSQYLHALLRIAPQSVDLGNKVLGMLEAHPPHELFLVHWHAKRFARTHSDRFIKLLAAHWNIESLSHKTRKIVARAPPAHDVHILSKLAGREDQALASFLLAQAPRDRRATIEAIDRNTISVDVLKALPVPYGAEVTAQYIARCGDNDEELRGFLMFDKERESILEDTKRSTEEQRSQAWHAYVLSASRTRDPLLLAGAVEQLASRIRNEQSTVRHTVLRSLLDEVSPHMWSKNALPHLSRLAKDTMNSPPIITMYLEAQCLSRLSCKIARENFKDDEVVQWAVDTVLTLNETMPQWLQWGPQCARAVAHLLCRTLPLANGEAQDYDMADRDENEYDTAFAIARMMRGDTKDLPELQTALWYAAEHASRSEARQAIHYLLQPWQTRDEVVGKLLAMDPSTVCVAGVSTRVASRRTDLMDCLLKSAPEGRFRPSKYKWRPPTVEQATIERSWTATQQQAFVDKLCGLVNDEAIDLTTRVALVKPLGSVPPLVDAVRQWLDSDKVTLQEAAMYALRSSPDALPLLLERAHGDSSGAALYAAKRASRFLRPKHLTDKLGAILLDEKAKISSRRLVIQMVADLLPLQDQVALLAQLCSGVGIHHDILALCAKRVVSDLLFDESIWSILEAAAASTEESPRRALFQQVVDNVPTRYRERFAALIVPMVQTPDKKIATEVLENLIPWRPWAPQLPRLAAPIVLDLSDSSGSSASEALWKAACDVLASTWDSSVEAVTGVVRSLRDDANDSDQDHPGYRRVAYLADQLQWSRDTEEKRAALKALSTVLAESDLTVNRAVKLLARTLVFTDEVDKVLADVDAILALCDARPALALTAMLDVYAYQPSIDGKDAAARNARLAVAEQLAQRGTAAEGQLALYIARGLRKPETPPYDADGRELLVKLRKHPVGDVRDAAMDVDWPCYPCI